jgi:hypothetical protein
VSRFLTHWRNFECCSGWPDWTIFRPLGDCSLWAILGNFNNWATLSHNKCYAIILPQIDWATFWAIFSQTHLVTLPPLYATLIFCGLHFHKLTNAQHILNSHSKLKSHPRSIRHHVFIARWKNCRLLSAWSLFCCRH